MKDILDSRKAFDLTRYNSGKEFNVNALIRDTEALVIETSGEIHSFFLAVLPDGRVVIPSISKTKDVSSSYAADSLQTLKESTAGIKIRQTLLDEPVNTVAAWISPPGGEFNYQEGRFEIGCIRNLLGFKILQCYGIPLKNIHPAYCERLFLMLEEFSDKPGQNINNPEDLRDKIVSFLPPNSSNWLDFLQEIFPELSSVFEKIKSGEVLHAHLKALRDARQEVPKAIGGEIVTKENLIYQNDKLVYIGAQIERGMQARGWNLAGGGCGYLNSDLLDLQNKGMFGMIKVVKKEQWTWKPGWCREKPEGCGQFKQEVGPCNICKDCQKKYDTANTTAT